MEAVSPAVNSDMWLRSYYEWIKLRAGTHGARIATAMRLLTIVYRVLKEKRDYLPAKRQMRENISLAREKKKVVAVPSRI